MFTVIEKNVKAFVGGFVTVHGGLFTSSCVVSVAGKTITPNEVTDDALTFAPPSDVGDYSFTITNGSVSSPAVRLVVVDPVEAAVNRLPKRANSEFLQMLLGLMPKGFIFNLEPGSNFYKIFSAIADLLLLIYNLFRSLVVEESPVTSTEMDLWENELGLPRDGLQQSTDAGRKSEIIRIARKPGGCTVPHYQQIIDLLGRDCKIYEYWQNPSVFPDWVADENGSYANFFVMFKVFQKEFKTSFKCNGKCNKALGNERDLVLEKLLEFDKPAHARFIYSYAIRVLTDENENPLTTDDGKLLIV